MRTTIDAAGRLVIPKQLRERAGLQPGIVEVVVDGAGVRIEAVAGDTLEERDGRLVIPGTVPIDEEGVRALRHADQR